EPEAGLMGTSAVVGTTIPHAVGFSYALRLQKSSAIVAVFFGDGAVEEGVFHESLNFAALKKLPVLFVCENNFYAIHTPLDRRQVAGDLSERLKPYGMQTACVEDNDVEKIYQEARRLVDAMRGSGQGPAFLECRAYRWREHVGPNEDFHVGYRSREEFQPWLESDAVARLAGRLETEARSAIEREVEAEVAAAFTFAEESPLPFPDELYTDVFKEA
ncbi:MAG: thiamine pyrophosphate-dependent dehydrogenase E1 component subunit alpha, partial [Armatimonadetes bacterium]|nr:thiamine pyrophosphate-dependent dehydrogenase E1 component subunit alpha [Armatimonadota bacterium]